MALHPRSHKIFAIRENCPHTPGKMRNSIKKSFYKASRQSWTRKARRKSLVFGLCYHRFEKEVGDDPVPGMAITPELFRLHVETLQEIGTFISIADAMEPSEEEGIRFVLTFDDGYRDNYEILLPILKEYNVPACIYITTDFVRKKITQLPHDAAVGFSPKALTSGQIQKLAASPLVTIGCHSATHKRLDDFWRKVWDEELVSSDQWLEETIGEEVMDFAFPYGQATDLVWHSARKYLIDTGYRSVVSNFGGANRPVIEDTFELDGKTLYHLMRVPMPAISDPNQIVGWTMGMANPLERFLPKRYLN
jgi:peptidoglycan/xylan/chitin deacetylase (PgdA/CDA1 family)